MMTSRAMFLSRFRGARAEEYLHAIEVARRRFRENLRLITFMKYRCRWFRRRIRKRFELLRKHGLCLCIMVLCVMCGRLALPLILAMFAAQEGDFATAHFLYGFRSFQPSVYHVALPHKCGSRAKIYSKLH